MMSENIYTYFAQFVRAAKKADWSRERINTVLEEARRGDYLHALETILEAMSEIEEETQDKETIRF